MARLKKHEKAFIVRLLAQFMEPSQVVEAVKENFKIDVSRQQVECYDPTKVAGAETTGQLAGTGSINADCTPINPVTNSPYFTVKKEGWGAGWTSGNVLRFNTIAAMFPVWVIRTVKQSEPTVLSDEFQIMLRGDIDRVV